MAEEKKTSETEPQEAEINVYMESPDGQGPKEDDRKAYLKGRHEEVKRDYKILCLQKEEAQGCKREDMLNQLTTAFRNNWKARRYVVVELRRMGEQVEDSFVPKSAV